MKCPVNFSRSLAILFFVSSWVPALLLGGGLSWPPPPSFWPPPVLGKAFTAVVGVTPGLKAFPSCLIDNTALARPFLAGLSRLVSVTENGAVTLDFSESKSPNGVSLTVQRFKKFTGGICRRAPVLRVWADRWRGGYDRQSLLSVNSLPFCVTVDERSPSCSTHRLLVSGGVLRGRQPPTAAQQPPFVFTSQKLTQSVVVWLQFSVKQPQLVDHAWQPRGPKPRVRVLS